MPINLLFVNNSIVSGLVEKEIIIEAVNTIDKQIKHLLNLDCNVTKNKLEELDLEVKIEIIQSFINNLDEINNETMQICLKNIKIIIEKIGVELKNIKKIKDEHESKWFSNYRVPDYENNFINLQKYTNIFNQRIDLLFKIESFCGKN
jgi:hypothetical protein